MQTIQKFRADDGAEFKAEAECIKHEALCKEVCEIVGTLPPLPKDDGCQFANGHGYIQHDADKFGAVRSALLRIGQRYITDPPWLQQALDKPADVHPSYPGRLMDDACPLPVNRAWYRVMCTDKDLREWGQPYYANNPEAAPGKHEVCAG